MFWPISPVAIRRPNGPAPLSRCRTRPGMPWEVLRAALIVATKYQEKPGLLALAEAALCDISVTEAQRSIWNLVAFALDPLGHADDFISEYGGEGGAALFDDNLNMGLVGGLWALAGADRLRSNVIVIRVFGRTASPEDDLRSGWVTTPERLSRKVSEAIDAIAADPRVEAGEALSCLLDDSNLAAWQPRLRHAHAQQVRLHRDHGFKHPAPSAVRDALAGGPPVNARDLRAIVIEELQRLRSELHTTDTTPWKRYWNLDLNGNPVAPRVENECRDHLLDRLRDRLEKYRIAAAVPEARRGEGTRTDMLLLTGAGRNLPIEAKRHFNPDLWVSASTQLQNYATDPGADGFGIYLVFWFGDVWSSTPPRPDGGARPISAIELEAMLARDLPAYLQARTDVMVFDVSDRQATRLKKRPRRSTQKRQDQR